MKYHCTGNFVLTDAKGDQYEFFTAEQQNYMFIEKISGDVTLHSHNIFSRRAHQLMSNYCWHYFGNYATFN